MKKIQNLPLHWQILCGMALGALGGLILQFGQATLDPFISNSGILSFLTEGLIQINHSVGQVFLRALRLIAVPIVVVSLILGAGQLNDVRAIGRIGIKTAIIYLFTTAMAITIGLLTAVLLQPGRFVPQAVRDGLAQAGKSIAQGKIEGAVSPSFWENVVNIVPTNPFSAVVEGNMIQVVFLSLCSGLLLSQVPKAQAKSILDLSEALNSLLIALVTVLMKLSPVAVFCLMLEVTASLGADILGAVFVYCLSVFIGLSVLLFGVYPLLLRGGAGRPFVPFVQAIAPAQLLAFSSSSSAATLPVTMECAEKNLKVSNDVRSFVLPLGATINMDGTALYQGVASLFIAQLYGIDLGFNEMLTIVLTATLASIGTAGVPGVGLIMLVIVLESIGLSPEVMAAGLAIIFGVDRILDMCRTTVNVSGDCMVAVLVDHLEQKNKAE